MAFLGVLYSLPDSTLAQHIFESLATMKLLSVMTHNIHMAKETGYFMYYFSSVLIDDFNQYTESSSIIICVV